MGGRFPLARAVNPGAFDRAAQREPCDGRDAGRSAGPPAVQLVSFRLDGRVERGLIGVNQSEHYHVGIVVPDLIAGRARFAELVGVVWGPIMEWEQEFVDGAGDGRVLPLRACYSTAAPYLELIEELPGTEWECNEYSNIHHIGFWSDAVAVDSARWSTAGCPLTLGASQEGELNVAYHRDPLGVRLELVSTRQREMIEQVMCVAPDTA
jgi:hypothetical protein